MLGEYEPRSTMCWLVLCQYGVWCHYKVWSENYIGNTIIGVKPKLKNIVSILEIVIQLYWNRSLTER